MKKLTNKQIIEKVSRIRIKNNHCWMALLQLAFDAKPRKAKQIMQQINRYDTRVTLWMSKLGQ